MLDITSAKNGNVQHSFSFLVHGFQPHSSNIPPGRHSESNWHSPVGRCRRDNPTPTSAPWSHPAHLRPRCSLWRSFSHPGAAALRSRCPAVPVCKNVQSQNQPLKTGIEFLCQAGKTAGFEPDTAATILPVQVKHQMYINNYDSWQGFGQSNRHHLTGLNLAQLCLT